MCQRDFLIQKGVSIRKPLPFPEMHGLHETGELRRAGELEHLLDGLDELRFWNRQAVEIRNLVCRLLLEKKKMRWYQGQPNDVVPAHWRPMITNPCIYDVCTQDK